MPYVSVWQEPKQRRHAACKRHNRKQASSEIEKEISETLFIQKNRSVFWPGNFLEDCLSQYGVYCASEDCLSYRSQGPEEMCLSLEHQNPSKTSEKVGYFDRVTVSLHILYTANQETRCSQDSIVPGWPFGRGAVRQRGYGSRLLIFKIANNKVDLGQIRSEEIVYSRYHKDPIGPINRAKRQVQTFFKVKL